MEAFQHAVIEELGLRAEGEKRKESKPKGIFKFERLNTLGFVPESLKAKSQAKYHSTIGLRISEFRTGVYGDIFSFDSKDCWPEVEMDPNSTMIPNSRIVIRTSWYAGICFWKISSTPCLIVGFHFRKTGLGAEAKSQQENRNNKK